MSDETLTPPAPETDQDANLSTTDFEWGTADFSEPSIEVKRVTVLHGYGRVPPQKKHYIDEIEFIGGVAKHVPEERAKEWKEAGAVRIHILPDESTDVDYARKVGMKPMNPTKLAALLGASDIDQLVQALGHEKTQALLAALNKRLSAAPRRGAR